MHAPSSGKRNVIVRVLPGEPTDGGGRVCIHLFVQDPEGKFTEPHALHPELDESGQPIKQKLVARPTRGRLACDPRRALAPVVRGNDTAPTPRSDDPRAVTCPKCVASPDYLAMMRRLADATNQA